MSTDLTGAEIDAIQDRFATDGDPTHDDVWTLIDYARSISARLASARQEGYREGVEAGGQWCRVRAYCAAIREREATDEQSRRAALLVKQTLDHAADVLPALSPPPAEPSAPVAEGDRVAALREAGGIHRYRDKQRIAALEAENTKLRAALGSYPNPSKYCGMHGFEEQRFFADYDTFRSRARALLQGGPDAG